MHENISHKAITLSTHSSELLGVSVLNDNKITADKINTNLNQMTYLGNDTGHFITIKLVGVFPVHIDNSHFL